ncbi:MAG: thiol peroxidase [Rothia sp. (in: high G+C Gram-positive bacteria)]|nr:thiol peroxidase [Rothia sp. (in: high G+C Gram-positive bacteria)]
MSETKLEGNPVSLSGQLPQPGTKAIDFSLVDSELKPLSLGDFAGQRVILNIFPSIDTGVCAQSVRTFNKEAASLENTAVLCISMDLPFAAARFCAAEGLDRVITASAFRSTFGQDYGLLMSSGPLEGLLARAVIVLDESAQVIHSQLVPEISQEPDYRQALASL